MKWLSYKLWKEKKALRPSRQFRSALWKKLYNAWQEIYLPKVFWYQMPAFRYSMVVLAVLIFVSTTGVGAYAYNSPEVIEGTRLYGVKRAIERVEEKVVERRAPEKQAKFYLKQIERRETEKQVMVRRGRVVEQIEKVEEKIQRTEQRLEIINSELNKIPEKIKDSVLKERLNKRLEIMEIKRDKLENKEINKLIINQKPYEESSPSISGGNSGVGNGNASTSSQAIGNGSRKVRPTSSVYTR